MMRHFSRLPFRFVFAFLCASLFTPVLPTLAQREQQTPRRTGPVRYTNARELEPNELRISVVGDKKSPDEMAIIGWHNVPKVNLSWLRNTGNQRAGARVFYQVTMTPPPTTPDGWKFAPDWVTTGDVPMPAASANSATIPLDVTRFIPKPPDLGKKIYPILLPTQPGIPFYTGAANGGNNSGKPTTSVSGIQKPGTIPINGLGKGTVNFKAIRMAEPSPVPPSVAAAQIYASGQTTYYIRLVMTDGNGEGLRVTKPVRLIVEEEKPSAGATGDLRLYGGSPGSGEFKVPPEKYKQGIFSAQRGFAVRYGFNGISPARVLIQVNRVPEYDPQRWNAPELNLHVVEVPTVKSGAFIEAAVTLPKTFPINEKLGNTICYVRALALNADGSLAAVPPRAYIFLNNKAMLDAPAPEIKVDAPPAPPPSSGLAVNVTAEYIPERFQTGNDIYRFVTVRDLKRPVPGKPAPDDGAYLTVSLINKPGSPDVIPAGTKLFLPPGPPPDKGLTDYIGDFLTGLYDFIAAVVNWISQAYTDLQNGIVSFVADATGLPPSVVRFGLQFAMSSLGLPPALPNMDQLMEQGLDYLTEQAVSQMGIPPELQDVAKNKMKAGLKEMAASLRTSAPPSYAWKPDPDFGHIPPRMVLRVTTKWNGSEAPPASGVQLSPVDIAAYATINDASTLGAQTQNVRLFLTSVPLPRLKGGESLTIPVCLSPVFGPHYGLAISQNVSTRWQVGGIQRTAPLRTPWK